MTDQGSNIYTYEDRIYVRRVTGSKWRQQFQHADSKPWRRYSVIVEDGWQTATDDLTQNIDYWWHNIFTQCRIDLHDTATIHCHAGHRNTWTVKCDFMSGCEMVPDVPTALCQSASCESRVRSTIWSEQRECQCSFCCGAESKSTIV